MGVTLKDYKKVREFLDREKINSILYGSLGSSVYLGNYKEFDDIDLLINKKYIKSEWKKLVKIMCKNGFVISDEREHEFINAYGVKVAFAGTHVLSRDKICTIKTGVSIVDKDGIAVRTLTRDAFIKAYLFSSKDGYRKEKRGKNDLVIVEMLKKE